MFKAPIQLKLSRDDVQQALQEYLNRAMGSLEVTKMEIHTSGGHSVTLEVEPMATMIHKTKEEIETIKSEIKRGPKQAS